MSALVIHTVAELRKVLDAARAAGKKISAVPTMGALHEGHLSLIRSGAACSEEVVTTIFVNPTQFGPNEDFDKYPRNLTADAALASSAGATIIFAPEVSEMYPQGEQTRVRVSGISEGLCGAVRPGHFEGVTTIVAKLFHAVGDAHYFFGQKDYQQLKVIEQMARDLLFPVRITGCPTVREADGLALSSRNAYLSEVERKLAPEIARALQKSLDLFQSGERDVEVLLGAARAHLAAHPFQIQYLELRDAERLEELGAKVPGAEHARAVLLFAGYLGTTRLIDNIVLASDTPRLF